MSQLSPGQLFWSIIALFINYLRMSQIVPMITVWLFVLLTLAGMTVVNFQDQSYGVMDGLFGLWQRQAWLPQVSDDTLDFAEANQNITINLDTEDFSAIAVKIWGGLSLVLLLMDLVSGWIFGKRSGPGLTRQILLVLAFAVAGFSGFMFNYFFGSEYFNGGLMGWIGVFAGLPLLAWMVSVYSLGVSAVLGFISRLLHSEPDDEPGPVNV